MVVVCQSLSENMSSFFFWSVDRRTVLPQLNTARRSVPTSPWQPWWTLSWEQVSDSAFLFPVLRGLSVLCQHLFKLNLSNSKSTLTSSWQNPFQPSTCLTLLVWTGNWWLSKGHFMTSNRGLRRSDSKEVFPRCHSREGVAPLWAPITGQLRSVLLLSAMLEGGVGPTSLEFYMWKALVEGNWTSRMH